jgi:hypothetical protein
MVLSRGGLCCGAMRFGGTCRLCNEGGDTKDSDSSGQTARARNPDGALHGNLLWRTSS